MRIIGIIGGMDFLGCDITLKFLAKDYQVKVPVPHFFKTKNQLIHTGLSAHMNLEICRIDPDDFFQMRNFAQDCDILIHCGTPLKLSVSVNGTPVYVPLIKGTNNLLKIVREIPSIAKIIFITCPVALNSDSGSWIFSNEKIIRWGNGAASGRPYNHHLEKARFHAERAVQKATGNFSDNRFKVMVVSPVEVKNNMLSSSSESSSAGLQFLFRNKIPHDSVFQKLVRHNVLNTMTNVNDLPEAVFNEAIATEMG